MAEMDQAAPPAVDVDELFADFEDVGEAEAEPAQAIVESRKPAPERHHHHRSDKLLALNAENRRLRDEVKLLRRFGSTASSVKHTNGPMAQVCFFNRKLSVTQRRKIEEVLMQVCSSERQSSSREEIEVANATSHWSTLSQPSAVSLTSESVEFVDDGSDDDDIVVNGVSSASASVSTAGLAITGSIQVHPGFMIDTLGAPVLNESAVASACFHPPLFVRGFHHTLPTTAEELHAKISKGNLCFNCSQPGHAIFECSMLRDEVRIQKNRQQFAAVKGAPKRVALERRYHADPDVVTDGQGSRRLQPGVLSAELRQALGLAEKEVPLHVYRMRVLGYPPAYQLRDGRRQFEGDKIKCTLSLYSGQEDVDDDVMEIDAPEAQASKESRIDLTPTAAVAHSVRYPGFNCPMPRGVVDRWQDIGVPPFAGTSQAVKQEEQDKKEEKEEGEKKPDLVQVPPPVQVQIVDSEDDDDVTSHSRRSAKFSRGDAGTQVEREGTDSADDQEDGEIRSHQPSPAAGIPLETDSQPVDETSSMPRANGTEELDDQQAKTQANNADEQQPSEEMDETSATDAVDADNVGDLIDISAGSPAGIGADMDEPGGVASASPHTPPAPKRQWSTDFPPDMAPAEGDLKHRWLTLRRLVDDYRSQDQS